MEDKDWKIYTILAHKLHIFLLRGNSKSRKINNCEVIFHTRRKLFSLLRKNMNRKNRNEILSLIQQINAIYRGIYDDKRQKTLLKK